MKFRACARHRTEHKAVLRIGAARERPVVVVDIGLCGACIVVADEPPEPATVVRLSVSAPTSWEPLVFDAVVRWRAEPEVQTRVGLEFAPLDPTSALALTRWLATLPLAS